MELLFSCSTRYQEIIAVYILVNESDPRSNVHYLGSSENKAWKKFRSVRDLCDTGVALYQLS